MRKFLTLAVALCSLATLTGCMKIDIENFGLAEEEDLSFAQNWDSFTFPALNGGENLTVTRTSQEDEILSIKTSKYKGNFLAVAVYQKDCETCKEQAVLLDKLAQKFPESLYGINFAVVFLDIFDETKNKNVEWLKDLTHVDVYANVATACENGACRKVFLPYTPTPLAGNIYYVNKANVGRTRKSVAWHPTDTPEEAYNQLEKEVARVLNLNPVTFTPDVEGWEGGETGTVGI